MGKKGGVEIIRNQTTFFNFQRGTTSHACFQYKKNVLTLILYFNILEE
jgi:hypothetical protein